MCTSFFQEPFLLLHEIWVKQLAKTSFKKIIYYHNTKMISKNHTCYYFDGIININNLDFDNILSDERPLENLLTQDVACKTPFCAMPREPQISGVFFSNEKYQRNFHRIKYGGRSLIEIKEFEKEEQRTKKVLNAYIQEANNGC